MSKQGSKRGKNEARRGTAERKRQQAAGIRAQRQAATANWEAKVSASLSRETSPEKVFLQWVRRGKVKEEIRDLERSPVAAAVTHRLQDPKQGELYARILAAAVQEKEDMYFFYDPLWRLTEAPWVRQPEDWVPRGKGATRLFLSLVQHLFCRYKVPEFLFHVFSAPAGIPWGPGLVAHLGSGGSMVRAAEAGLFPAKMTKRMCHLFLQSPAERSVIKAARYAQVLGLGGERRVADSLGGTPVGGEFRGAKDEAFILTFLQWLVNNPMLDKTQVGPLWDYIGFKRRQDGDAFVMAGRSPMALLDAMHRWHGELALAKALKKAVYAPTGWSGGEWHFKRKGGQQTGEWTEIWRMEEILTSEALRAEGAAMRHCVASYGSSMEEGRISIWSLRSGPAISGERSDRRLTVEVVNGTGQIVQARGPTNRAPTLEEDAVLRRWATKEGLTISSTGRW